MRKYYYITGKNGMDLTCDQCGRAQYLKRLKNWEYVGNFMVPEKYEDPSEGWTHPGDRDICPSCNTYNETVSDLADKYGSDIVKDAINEMNDVWFLGKEN